MTNFQIIFNEAVANGLYTEAEAISLIQEHGGLPLHTFAEWKRHGLLVKKGEHAKLTCYIWRMKNKTGTLPMKDGDDVEIDENHWYKTKAFFFTRDQVEKAETA